MKKRKIISELEKQQYEYKSLQKIKKKKLNPKHQSAFK